MNDKSMVLDNKYWTLDIKKIDDNNYIYNLYDKLNKITYADMDYFYGLFTSQDKGELNNLEYREIELEKNNTIIVKGKYQNKAIEFKQEFKLDSDSRWLEEYITIYNNENEKVVFSSINFGLRKILLYQHKGWSEHLDRNKLTAIPTRRFLMQGVDRRLESFSANDLVYDPWLNKEDTSKPGFDAEGWLWGNDEGGILICKYNQTELEFSRFKRFPIIHPGRGVEDIAIIFGGVSLCSGQPELVFEIEPGKSHTFGVTKYCIYAGDYKEGYYLYRSHLDEMGYKFKPDYNPPLHYPVFYNLGWFGENEGWFSDNKDVELYKLEDLYKEAETAKDIGAECFQLDPGWDIICGSTIWDNERLGSLKEFSGNIHNKYGLKLGLHISTHFLSGDEADEFYYRDKEGKKRIEPECLNLFYVCTNEAFIKEKTRRLLNVVKYGIDFLMFDWVFFPADGIGCCCPDHGHEVPMKRKTHKKNIIKIIQNLKKQYPNLLIESHDISDTKGLNGHQLYFQYDLPHSFDENWGFEYIWNALEDLISSKAVSLYEYNMAYSIPVHLVINENSDNINMLQFWWYASVVRHLGIGGLSDKSSKKYKALKNAVKLYKKLKPFFTRGIFYGIEPMIHLHVDEGERGAVLTAYNLSSSNKRLKVNIDIIKYNIKFKNINAYNGLNEEIKFTKTSKTNEKLLEIEFDIPAMSPVIIELT